MSTQEPGQTQPGPPLPEIDDLPSSTEGYDRAKVQEAFDAFRRHVTALQANLRVLQAAPTSATADPSVGEDSSAERRKRLLADLEESNMRVEEARRGFFASRERLRRIREVGTR